MPTPCPTAILLVSCPDQRGIVAALAGFITAQHGNILALDQYVDAQDAVFFARMEWELEGFAFPLEEFPTRFAAVADAFDITWTLHRSDKRRRMASWFPNRRIASTTSSRTTKAANGRRISCR